MPVSFRVDDSSGAIFTTAREIVSYAELVDHVAAKVERGLMARAELFDARDITLDLSLGELQQVADRVKEALGSQKPGKIAVITNSAFVYGLARAYAALSREDNPRFEIFQDEENARTWLLADS